MELTTEKLYMCSVTKEQLHNSLMIQTCVIYPFQCSKTTSKQLIQHKVKSNEMTCVTAHLSPKPQHLLLKDGQQPGSEYKYVQLESIEENISKSLGAGLRLSESNFS